MRRLALGVGLTALAAAVGGVVFLWPAPRSGPEPIVYGRDTCAHCRMHLSQPGFAGELRDRNGLLRKYDDVGCMLSAMLALHQAIPEAWVEGHDGGGFIPLVNATLVRAEDIDTPMGSGIVAFEHSAAAAAFAAAHRGAETALEDLLRDPLRLAGREPRPSR